jgi:hypothetical protein
MQFLSKLLRSTRAGVAFISETKSSQARATHLLSNIQGFTEYVVPSTDFSGGLWLLWSQEIVLQVLESTRYYIFARIRGPDQFTWVLRAIYEDASHRNNGFIWDKIRAYVDTGSDTFCCLGDFNAISSMEEKIWWLENLQFKQHILS